MKTNELVLAATAQVDAVGTPPGRPMRTRARPRTRRVLRLEAPVRVQPVGVLSLEGKVHFEAPRLWPRAHRTDDELALETWRALIEGTLSLVEHVDHAGRRQYHLYENPPRAVAALALNRIEAAVVSQVARGVMNKEVGYALGLSASQVSRALKTASGKLGLATGKEVVRVAALLHRARLPVATTVPLTAAERQVMDLLREGLSDEEIAARRGTTRRTIANQVAGILRKTGAHTRRAFLGLGPGREVGNVALR